MSLIKKSNHEQGFTLIELVSMMMIIGILGVFAVPKFFTMGDFTGQAFFDDTLNALRYAQKLAVATGCEVKVSFSANAYQLKRRGNPASTSCPTSGSSYALDVPHPATGSSYSGSEAGVTLTSSVSEVIFYPLGDASANVTVTVAGKTISVIGESGFVYAP